MTLVCDGCYKKGFEIPYVCYGPKCKEKNQCSSFWFCSKKCHDDCIIRQKGTIFHEEINLMILVCLICGNQTEHNESSPRETLTCLNCYVPMKKFRMRIES